MSADTHLLIAYADDYELDTSNRISETRKLHDNSHSELHLGHDEDIGNLTCSTSHFPPFPELSKAICPGFLAVAILLFVIGFIKFDDCPVEPELPFLLIIEGAVIVVKIILRTSYYCFGSDHAKTKNIDESSSNYFQDTLHGLIALFLALWSITGCILVYGMYSKVQLENPNLPEYCDKTLYITAFSFATLFCAFVIFVIMGLLCLSIIWFYKDKCLYNE